MNFLVPYIKFGIKVSSTEASRAYLAALQAVGAQISRVQRNLIHSFFVLGEAQGWLAGIQRLVLPVWNSAAANSICAATLEIMIFQGSVSHSGRKIKSTGGYLDSLINPITASLTYNNCSFGAYTLTSPDDSPNAFDMGARLDGASQASILALNYGGSSYAAAGVTPGVGNYIVSATIGAGLYTFNASFTGQKLYFNSSEIGSRGANSGPLANRNIWMMRSNNADSGAPNPATKEYAAFFIAKDWTNPLATQFSTALYNLISGLRENLA